MTDNTARLDIKSAISLTSNMEHFNYYLARVNKFYSPYIFEQCEQNASAIERVEVILSENYYKPDGMRTKCIKEFLYKMRNLKRLGVTRIEAKAWPVNLLKELSYIKTLSALDMRNEKTVSKEDVVHFGKYFEDTSVEELNIINLVPEGAIDFVDQIKILKIKCPGDGPFLNYAVVVANNAFVLKSLKIDSTFREFTYFLVIVQLFEFPRIEELEISHDNFVKYQLENVKVLDRENKIVDERRMYLYAQSLRTLFEVFGKLPLAVVTIEHLDVTIPEELNRKIETFAFFTNLLMHHAEIQRLSVQVNVVRDECKNYLKDIWAENHCKIFSNRQIIFKEIINGLENDKIEFNINKVGLKATIPSGKFYELFAHEENIELDIAESNDAYQYIAWFSILIRIVELKINEPTNLFLLIIEKVINNRQNIRNGELIWANLKFLRGNIKAHDEERVKPIFQLEKLQRIIFALPDQDSANKVEKWQIDQSVWSPGKIIVDSSGLNLVEFRKLTAPSEEMPAYF